jgi:integrase
MAFVEKRGPSRWRARYRGPNGRERSKTFDRRSDAERWLATEEADKARGTWIDPSLGRVTFAQWAEEWLGLQIALKPKTRVGYEGILRGHLLPAFGDWPLTAIEPIHAQRFVAELEASGAGPRTVRNVYRVLSGIMRAAVVSRRIPSSPCVGVTLPRAANREMVVLAPDQIADLAAELDDVSAALVTFAAYTGLRWGEIAALRVGRVNLLRPSVDVLESATEAGQGIRFVNPKNGRTRTVSLPRSLASLLEPHVAGRESGELVFPARNGGPMRHGQFYTRVFRPAVARAGLDQRLRFHDLRHTCAALLIAQGAHPRAIMERLGHSSITVTMDTYGHLLPSLDDALSAGLDSALLGARAAYLRPERGQVVELATAT